MRNIFKIILEISIYSSALIAAVLALNKLFSGKISAKVRHILWLLVLLRLLLPATFESPVNVPYPAIWNVSPTEAAPEDEPAQPDLTDAFFAESAENESSSYNFAENTTESEAYGNQSFKLDIKAVFVLLWLSGAALFIAVSLYKIINYSRKIRNITTTNLIYGARLEVAKSTLGIKKKICIAESKHADIPLVCGIIHPVILFPEGWAQTIGGKKLSYIILHELCHVKRRDLIINYIWMLARALHWFNPLVHIAYKSYLDTVEEACDEMVIRQLKNHERYEYSQSLLDVARLANASKKPALSVSLFGSGTSIRKRVMKMMHSNRKSKTFTVITALIACVMCFACFTTACRPEQAVEEPSQQPAVQTSPEASPSPAPEASEDIEISYSHSELDKPTEEKTTPYDPEMSEEEAMQIIAQLGLSEVETLRFIERKDYFGDSLVYFSCNEGAQSALYIFLESVHSPVSFENEAVDMTLPIGLPDDEFKTIASDYAKKIWGYEDIEFTSCESGPLGPEGEFYYFGADGVINETGRIFHISLNGQGELWGFTSYPSEVDMEKGVSIDQAREIGLALLRKEAHITDESNLTLISETLSTEYAPMFIFKYEYRSDNPTAEEFDYDCEVKVMAADGRTMGAGIKPITSNLNIIQPEEAELLAKELIAETHYGSKDMADRLQTTVAQTGLYWGVTDDAHGPICYFFCFDYIPKDESDPTELYSYTIEVLSSGEFSDIGYGPTNN